MKRASYYLIAFSLLIALSLPAFADIKSDKSKGLPIGRVLVNALGSDPTDELVKNTVKSMVGDGANVGQLIKVALSLGYDSCAVIKGAISGGGDVTVVVQSAMSGGVDSDSLAECSQDAGADPELVASAIADYNAGKGELPSAIPNGGLGGGGTDISPRR